MHPEIKLTTLISQKIAPAMKQAFGLSIREIECLTWASDGKTDAEISTILNISRSTAIKHIVSARKKLGATNRTHAVVLALRMGLIEYRPISGSDSVTSYSEP